jgi:hypothetical protein
MVPARPPALGYSPPPMIDESTVHHVARLARLRLRPDEEQVMQRELGQGVDITVSKGFDKAKRR